MAGPSARSTQNKWSIVHTDPRTAIDGEHGHSRGECQPRPRPRAESLGVHHPGGENAHREKCGEIRRVLGDECPDRRLALTQGAHRGDQQT